VFDTTGFAQTLPQRSLDRGRPARRLEAENPTIGIVGCCTRAASGQAVRLALNPTSICGLPSRFPWATARLKAAGIAAVRDFDPAYVRSGVIFVRSTRATNAPGMFRFAPIACEFQRFAVTPGVMVTRSTSATLG
jgi:hypothetical protein